MNPQELETAIRSIEQSRYYGARAALVKGSEGAIYCRLRDDEEHYAYGLGVLGHLTRYIIINVDPSGVDDPAKYRGFLSVLLKEGKNHGLELSDIVAPPCAEVIRSAPGRYRTLAPLLPAEADEWKRFRRGARVAKDYLTRRGLEEATGHSFDEVAATHVRAYGSVNRTITKALSGYHNAGEKVDALLLLANTAECDMAGAIYEGRCREALKAYATLYITLLRMVHSGETFAEQIEAAESMEDGSENVLVLEQAGHEDEATDASLLHNIVEKITRADVGIRLANADNIIKYAKPRFAGSLDFLSAIVAYGEEILRMRVADAVSLGSVEGVIKRAKRRLQPKQ